MHCVLISRTESSFVTENFALLIMLQLGHLLDERFLYFLCCLLFTPFMFVCLFVVDCFLAAGHLKAKHSKRDLWNRGPRQVQSQSQRSCRSLAQCKFREKKQRMEILKIIHREVEP